MGWASGSGLMSNIIGTLKGSVKDAKVRQTVYEGIIPAFEDADCDTLSECEGEDKAFAKALKKLHPDWYGD